MISGRYIPGSHLAPAAARYRPDKFESDAYLFMDEAERHYYRQERAEAPAGCDDCVGCRCENCG
jgi:hypothetical protein